MSDRYHFNGEKWEHHWTDPDGYDFLPSEVMAVRPNHSTQSVDVLLENGKIICPDYTSGGDYEAECDLWRRIILDTLPEGTTFPRGSSMKITDEKRKCVKALLDKAYEVLEHTDDYISIGINNKGVDIYAMHGPFNAKKEYKIVAAMAWEWLDDTWAQSMTRVLTKLENVVTDE